MVAHSPALTESTATRQIAAPRNRVLGLVGMLASPLLFFSFAAAGFDPEGKTILSSFLGLVFTIGWFSNVFGLLTLRATGKRLPGRILLGVELFGVTLAILCQVYEIVAPGSTSVLYGITDAAWPLSMLTLLISGIVVAIVGNFRGWMRFAPLFCGLWLPISITLMNTVGVTAGQVYGGLHVALGWLLLGYAVRLGGGIVDRD